MPSPYPPDLLAREVVTARILTAPRERVFQAWTDPGILALWWGPTGFRNTFETFDLRPGGDWRFVMHGPDGRDYPNYSVFREIAAPERLVFDHISPPVFQITVTFDAIGARTKLTFRMLFETAESCARLKPLVIEANEQNFDRLATVLGLAPA